MRTNDISPEQHRKNVRLAFILAVVVLFMLLTSVPFWRGLFNMVMSGAL